MHNTSNFLICLRGDTLSLGKPKKSLKIKKLSNAIILKHAEYGNSYFPWILLKLSKKNKG